MCAEISKGKKDSVDDSKEDKLKPINSHSKSIKFQLKIIQNQIEICTQVPMYKKGGFLMPCTQVRAYKNPPP